MNALQTSKTLFCIIITVFAALQATSQTTPNLTKDYGLFGYPSVVRYMKFETDTADNPKIQRTAFIDDYQLTFNERRELLKRTNFINGTADRQIILDYDNKRHLVKETLQEADGKIVSVTDYKYGYIGRVSQITITEYPDSRAGANTLVYKETYDYNKKGQLETKTIYNNGSDTSKQTKYYYGPADSLIYTISTYGNNKNVEKVSFKRDFKHDVIEMLLVRNDKQARREEYDLNKQGQCVTKRVYNGKNKLILTYSYQYDQHGNLTAEVGVDDKGIKAIEFYYKYEKDKFFNWTKRTMYDSWNPKYVETRTIEYIDKEHFYDDMKDEDRGRVVKDNR
ncbi:MAG: hypothetical protein LBL74_05600 [Bacteroidales bacterium]|jgi:hypothetical protein|nr:hypothetical protein [Bacteroidales bacterium]